MAGHGAPVPASRTPHAGQSRWRHPPEEDKKESPLRGWGSFFPRRANDAAGSAREATVSPAEGEARRGCPAAPGWRLPPRPELARRRPGRALGSAPPPPSLRPSLLLLRRRRRRGGRGRGGGSYCGERRADREGGGLQQLMQEGAGAAHGRRARPARRGSARSAPALVHCERLAAGGRAGRASTTAMPPPPDARAPRRRVAGNKASRSTQSHWGAAGDPAAGGLAAPRGERRLRQAAGPAPRRPRGTARLEAAEEATASRSAEARPACPRWGRGRAWGAPQRRPLRGGDAPTASLRCLPAKGACRGARAVPGLRQEEPVSPVSRLKLDLPLSDHVGPSFAYLPIIVRKRV